MTQKWPWAFLVGKKTDCYSLTVFQKVVSIDIRGREPRHVNTEDAEKVLKVC